MKITRIDKIKGHRVFQDYSWPKDLPDFARFNLIYGWNGSGKTTISNLLRHIQMRESVSEGEVNFHIDGNLYPGASLATASGLPQVRVFNREFVEANVFSTTMQLPVQKNSIFVQINKLSPIFFLGKDSVERQRQVEELTKTKWAKQQTFDDKSKSEAKADKSLDDFCIREAKAIKELLSSSGLNTYNNYDKTDFKTLCKKLARLDPPPVSIAEQEKIILKKQKDSTPKEIITAISLTVFDFEHTRQKVEHNLQRTVTSQVLEELLADPLLAEWVQQGLGHHTGDKVSTKCRFCDSPIPEGRIAKLEAHFNDEYNRFVTELDTTIAAIEKVENELTRLQFPDKAKFYEHLVPDYVISLANLNTYIAEAVAYLKQLARAVTEKRMKPFESLVLDNILVNTPKPDIAKATETIELANKVVTRHNTETENFQNIVTNARRRLEEGLAAEALLDFKKKEEVVKTIESDLQILQASIMELTDRILFLEKDIVEHRQPAEELNTELRSYLGRDELKFDLYESGYQITRHGVSARNLSEGERTAIAFLYFLKSLQAKEFTIADDIVVIDDPVSSLDANALFCAFGYMKERTKDAGQLFILTHNFAFFRQVKNWFNNLKHQKKKDLAKQTARFYMVEAEFIADNRSAAIKQLDPLLHHFESEYHYLFKKVYDEVNNGGAKRGLEEFYGMPNIARRLLESFLSFRYPAESGELKQQLDRVTFDPAKKARILRFLHTYSHDGKIAEPEHDLSILSETPAVLQDLTEMLKCEDPRHYDEMVKLLSETCS